MSASPDPEEIELLRCFANGTCETFSHEDHVHVAWLLLRKLDLVSATDEFRIGAKALAADRGHPEFYHETITCAFMRLINERISFGNSGPINSELAEAHGPTSSWPEFKARNLDLFEPNCGAIRKRYRPETIDSPEARLRDIAEDAIAPNG